MYFLQMILHWHLCMKVFYDVFIWIASSNIHNRKSTWIKNISTHEYSNYQWFENYLFVFRTLKRFKRHQIFNPYINNMNVRVNMNSLLAVNCSLVYVCYLIKYILPFMTIFMIIQKIWNWHFEIIKGNTFTHFKGNNRM